MNSTVYLCVPCHQVAKASKWDALPPHCPRCKAQMKDMGYRWRAPRKGNKKAWARIQAGDFRWDKKVVQYSHHRWDIIKGAMRRNMGA